MLGGLGKVVDGRVRRLEEVLHDLVGLFEELLHLLDQIVGVLLSLSKLVS